MNQGEIKYLLLLFLTLPYLLLIRWRTLKRVKVFLTRIVQIISWASKRLHVNLCTALYYSVCGKQLNPSFDHCDQCCTVHNLLARAYGIIRADKSICQSVWFTSFHSHKKLFLLYDDFANMRLFVVELLQKKQKTETEGLIRFLKNLCDTLNITYQHEVFKAKDCLNN